ncbi:hypothetical protein N8I77_001592 [Diaporthe amygdali]|uniref:Uncharacterized protein n=1 Tax=Phomopsis amygdali TaxID=1214568 RepID=A0AAD9W8F6_PHOAM|nr:hypothetical protein N8I77_001592 [Diaporthe amygdali]
MAPTSLDANADTTVRIIQRGPVKPLQVEYKVLAAAMSASPYWQTFIRHMNGSMGFASNNTHIEDTGITIVAVEIVLRGLHQTYHRHTSSGDGSNNDKKTKVEQRVKSNDSVNTDGASRENKGAVEPGASLNSEPSPANISASNQATAVLPEGGEALSRLDPMGVELLFPQELLRAAVYDVWGVLALINFRTCKQSHRGKFDVDRTVVRSWFLKWRETNFQTFNTQADFEKALFPTFAFDDANGFASATKWLCQKTSVGNIAEYSPFVHSQATQWYLHLHLPKEIISQIRIARSQLRVRVSQEIWSIIRSSRGWLSNSKRCACWVVAHYKYLEALKNAEVLCPELDRKKSVAELVKCIRAVEYEEPLNACLQCSNANIGQHLSMAIRAGLDFEGLCLDCMLASVTPNTSPHPTPYQLYADRFDRKHERCLSCRFRHQHASWYFSWVNEIPRQVMYPPRQNGNGLDSLAGDED